jgi:hypothetical protein
VRSEDAHEAAAERGPGISFVRQDDDIKARRLESVEPSM